MPNHDFYFARYVRKLALYSDVIHLFDWKSAVEHDVVFKMCDSVRTYIARDIPAFVMCIASMENLAHPYL